MIYLCNRFIVLIIILFPLLCDYTFQQSKVNQKKIEQEQQKKNKAFKKQYKQAVKRHKSMQSDETKKRMKRTKKESKKLTPVHPWTTLFTASFSLFTD